MEQVRYMISDAATIVAVESHVLRYWEDELELEVPRNEMGHRYYTQENVDQFLRIKQLKEEGYQLKAIKIMLQQEKEDAFFAKQPPTQEQVAKTNQYLSDQPIHRPEPERALRQPEQQFYQEEPARALHLSEPVTPRPRQQEPAQPQMTPQERMEQFQNLMTQIVRTAVTENNKALSKEIGLDVGDRVLKEMNYLMRMQDEQEEERFKKLDEAIRNHGKRQKKALRQKRKVKQKLRAAPRLES